MPDFVSKTLKLGKNNQQENSEEKCLDPQELINKLSQLKQVIILQNNSLKQDQLKLNNQCMVIYENELVSRLENLTLNGINYLINQDIFNALMSFKQCDLIAESAEQRDYNLPWKLLLLYKLNLGICFQKYGLLEEAFNKIDDSIMIIKNIKKKYQQNLDSQDSFYFFYKRITIQCLLQCCIILSELGRHLEALEFAKSALRKIVQLISKIYGYLFEQYSKDQLLECIKQILQSLTEITDILIIIREVIMKFESLGASILKIKTIKNIQRIINHPKSVHLQSLNSDIKKLHKNLDEVKISQCNILAFLQLKLITLDDISNKYNNKSEVTSESLLNKICILTVSFYCVSTEARFIEGPNNILSDIRESENYLSHALEISYLFLPHDMPLVAQIISVHNKFHGLSRQIIYEDKEKNNQNKNSLEQYDLILLKPFSSQQKQIPFVPLIRKCTTLSYKIFILVKKRRQFSLPPQSETENTQSSKNQIIVTDKKSKDVPSDNKAAYKKHENIKQQVQNRVKSAGRKIITQNQNQPFIPLGSQQLQLMDIYLHPNKQPGAVKANQSNPKGYQTTNFSNESSFFPKPKQVIQIQPIDFMKDFLTGTPQSINQKRMRGVFMTNVASPTSLQLQQNFFKDTQTPNKNKNFQIQISNNFNIQINNNQSFEDARKPKITSKPLQIYYPSNIKPEVQKTPQPQHTDRYFLSNQQLKNNNKPQIQISSKKRSISQKNQESKNNEQSRRLNASNFDFNNDDGV